MRALTTDPRHMVYLGDSLSEHIPAQVDCIITDPPYSDRTHAGHDSLIENDGSRRNGIDYKAWDTLEVSRAVHHWTSACLGWIVVLTDHILAPHWAACLEARGLYVFAPLPFLSPGSRIRLAGDGPSSWTCWIIVARPRCEPYCKWGTLPGGYVVAPEHQAVIGGKPLTLMKALVRDYSRPGDLVCDPCCGAGTTGRAAADLGRRSLQIDISEEHAQLAVNRMRQLTLGIEAEQQGAT